MRFDYWFPHQGVQAPKRTVDAGSPEDAARAIMRGSAEDWALVRFRAAGLDRAVYAVKALPAMTRVIVRFEEVPS